VAGACMRLLCSELICVCVCVFVMRVLGSASTHECSGVCACLRCRPPLPQQQHCQHQRAWRCKCWACLLERVAHAAASEVLRAQHPLRCARSSLGRVSHLR
jgi:hypothetical protein